MLRLKAILGVILLLLAVFLLRGTVGDVLFYSKVHGELKQGVDFALRHLEIFGQLPPRDEFANWAEQNHLSLNLDFEPDFSPANPTFTISSWDGEGLQKYSYPGKSPFTEMMFFYAGCGLVIILLFGFGAKLLIASLRKLNPPDAA